MDLTKGIGFTNVHACAAPRFREEAPRDVSGIVTALAQLSALDAVAEAIVEIVSRRLALTHVALRVHIGPDEPPLVRSWGRGGPGAVRRFALLAGGSTVGRLEVEASGHLHAEVLEQFLPCFAVLLRSAGAQPEALGDEDDSPVVAAVRRWALTPKEGEVVELLVQGLTNKEIANALDCKEGTVEVHVSHVLRKSRAGNRAGLVTKVWRRR